VGCAPYFFNAFRVQQIAGVIPAKLLDKKPISCVKYRKNKLAFRVSWKKLA